MIGIESSFEFGKYIPNYLRLKNFYQSLNVFFQSIIENKSKINLKYLRIWYQKPHFSRLHTHSVGLNIVQWMQKITSQTSIRSLSVFPIPSLSDDLISQLSFWFTEPFGEFEFEKNELTVIRYRANEMKLC